MLYLLIIFLFFNLFLKLERFLLVLILLELIIFFIILILLTNSIQLDELIFINWIIYIILIFSSETILGISFYLKN